MNDIFQPKPLCIKAGSFRDRDGVAVELSDKELSTHMAIYGGTGNGTVDVEEAVALMQMHFEVC